jgi:anti-sigma regulatory factor (Ser/Thr protein kinase)
VSVVLLPHATSSVAVARRRLSADLLSSGTLESVVDDATVIISELLSNALRHARPLETGQIRVAWSRHGDSIEVAVSDGGAATEPRRSRPTLSSLGGRGLAIVETLAECWGVRHEGGGGTTVWAILRVPQPAQSAPLGTTATPPAVVSVIPDVSATPTVNLLNGTR